MKLLPALLALSLAGCASFPTIDELRQDGSAGLVGCPPREIKIANNEKLTWTATCRGKTFQCTTGDGTSCTEMRQ